MAHPPADTPSAAPSAVARARTALDEGQAATARRLLSDHLAAHPQDATAHFLDGQACAALGDGNAAVQAYAQAVRLRPDYPEALLALGTLLADAGHTEPALNSLTAAVRANAAQPGALLQLGRLLRRMGRSQEALQVLQRAAQVEPDSAAVHVALGNTLMALGGRDQAIACYAKAARLDPSDASAQGNLGNALFLAGRLPEAMAGLHRAVSLQPGFAEGWRNLGTAHYFCRQFDEAAAAFRSYAELKPQDPQGFRLLGSALGRAGQPQPAIAAVERARALGMTDARTAAALLALKAGICDWSEDGALVASVLHALRQERAMVDVFNLIRITEDPADLFACVQTMADRRAVAGAIRRHARPPGERLRIGYLSADFNNHAVAILTAGLFEAHRRDDVEVFAYSYGRDDGSPMRRRLEAAFEHFVDIRLMPNLDAAQRIHDDGIDILVDMTGYTSDSRLEILAFRPAPVQASFFGFLSSTGADYVDYLIADAITAPAAMQPYFTEKLVHLPHCLQVNDRKRARPETGPSRAACGLPEHALVLCSFNASYKYTPAMFEVWMRLLQALPDAVLWLLDGPEVADHLRREAATRGVAAARLVFAPRMSQDEHLARHHNADLFLDSLPINAGATAADALWMGVPVLTCTGTTCVGRLATSMLHAVGLPELATGSLAEYEALALALGQDRPRLAALRRRLAENRLTTPLFDTELFARNLERAYRAMWDLHQRGEAPRPISLP